LGKPVNKLHLARPCKPTTTTDCTVARCSCCTTFGNQSLAARAASGAVVAARLHAYLVCHTAPATLTATLTWTWRLQLLLANNATAATFPAAGTKCDESSAHSQNAGGSFQAA
jgi:hypothetical protein